MNTNLKILTAFDTLEKKINALDNRFDSVVWKQGEKGDKGERGLAGKDGKDGKNGKDGRDGQDGQSGRDGKDGVDGKDGISIVDAIIDIDDHLVLKLSDGSEIDAGELASSLAPNQINYINGSGSGGTVANSGVKYTSVTTTPYYITSAELIVGRNIYGVDAGQNAFVYLPTDIPADKLVTINNESDTFTLTIDTYVE